MERTNPDSIKEALAGKHFDVVIDKIAYCSNNIKYVMGVIDCDKYIYMSSTAVYDPKTCNTKETDLNCRMGFICSNEAGEFMAYLADKDIRGAVNGCAKGTISLREIIDYMESKIGHKAVLSEDGDPAPYNGEPEYSINTEKAESLGYQFSDLKDWIYKLLDYYIEKCRITNFN